MMALYRLADIIALREQDLEMIKRNILSEIHDDRINNYNVACLMDREI